MEDFYIGGASVKLFLPILKMNFPPDCGHRVAGGRRLSQPRLREHPEDLPMQAHKIMHGLWSMGLMMFTKYRPQGALLVRT